MDPNERIFREGYRAGYEQGGDDQSSYEWGCGLKRRGTRQQEEDEAWNSSAAKCPNVLQPEYRL